MVICREQTKNKKSDYVLSVCHLTYLRIHESSYLKVFTYTHPSLLVLGETVMERIPLGGRIGYNDIYPT